jgi:hypothetical protein
MSIAIKKETSFKSILAAAKKLTAAEQQKLRLALLGGDALAEMKAFEQQLKKTKPLTKKSDAAIVKLTTTIRRTNDAKTKKMLH